MFFYIATYNVFLRKVRKILHRPDQEYLTALFTG